MTRAARMRAWIAANGPATATQIRDGMGLTVRQLKSTLYELTSKGMVESHGKQRPRTYTAGRPAREWGVKDPKAIAARYLHKLTYNAERRRKGDRTQAQIQADAQQQRIDAMTARLTDDNAKRRQAVAIIRGVSSPARKCWSDAAVPEPEAVESVEQWMARTGQRPHALRDGEVSPANRLQRIGRHA
jgi:predicted ArsR family transcriptional regulator